MHQNLFGGLDPLGELTVLPRSPGWIKEWAEEGWKKSRWKGNGGR